MQSDAGPADRGGTGRRAAEGCSGPVDQTPHDARSSAQEPVWQEEQAARQGYCCSDTVGSKSGSGVQHRRSVHNNWSSSSCLAAPTPGVLKRAEECQFESYPRVGDSSSADYDVTRMCKEGAKCSARKPNPAMREGQPDAVLMQLCEPSTRQSLNMWLESQCSSV